jgi:hypothetical protein
MHLSLFEQGNLLAECEDSDVEPLRGASVIQFFCKDGSGQLETRVGGDVRYVPPSGGFLLLSSRLQLT